MPTKGIMMERHPNNRASGILFNPSLGKPTPLDAMHEVISELMNSSAAQKKTTRDASLSSITPPWTSAAFGGDNPTEFAAVWTEFDLRAIPGMSNQALMAENCSTITSYRRKNRHENTVK